MKHKQLIPIMSSVGALLFCINANAFTEEQLAPEKFHSQLGIYGGGCVLPNAIPSAIGTIQKRQVWELMPDGTKRYVLGGNGEYLSTGANGYEIGQKSPSDYTADGWEVIGSCYSSTGSYRTKTGKVVSTPVPYINVKRSDVLIDTCPAGQEGSIKRYRDFELWNGITDYHTTNYDITIVNTCKDLTFTTQTQNAQDSCPEGQIGTIEKTRTYDLYSDGTIKNESDWSVTSNSCVAVPTETVTPYHFEVSCDSYYGAAKGSYTGTVMKSGNNVTNAAGETTFNLISTDTTSCVKAFSDEKEIITEEACPAGQTGTRIMSVVTAENGSGIVYPNGSTPIEKSNTCVTPLDSGSVNNPESETQASVKSAVLSNMSFTVSQLSSDSDSNLLVSQMNKFDSSKSDGSAHNFNIVANSLTSKSVNAANVTKVIKAYKAASGDSNVNVKVGGLSQSLYDYVGQGGLTAQKISSEKLVMLGAKEDSGVVTVSYASYLNQMKRGDVQTFTVKIYNQ